MVAAVGSRWFAGPLRRALGVGVAITLSLSARAACAQSTDSGLPTFNAEPSHLAGAAVLILLVLLTLAYRRYRRLLRERDHCASDAAVARAALDTDTEGVALWRRDSHHIEVPPRLAALLRLAGKPAATVDDLAACLAPEDGAGFASAALQLRVDGTPFELTADAVDGKRRLQISGARLSVGEYGEVDRLAFRDASKSLDQMREIERSRNRLAAILDSLPMPVWLRRSDLTLAYGNAAYARAVDAGRDEAIARGLEFTSGTDKASGQALARRALDRNAAQSEEKHVVVAGDRRLFEIAETPLPGLGSGTHIVGRAVDKTALEESRSELARHIGAHGDVLESLSTSIVIFGPDQRLKFFNNEYVKQFGLDDTFLETEPLLGEVLEALRERRKLPEQLDMPRYKKEIARELMSLISPREELLHLPDETTIRMVATPHPFGGVVITYEDVTDTLRVERLYNTLIQVQRETLDHLFEGIVVFGSDGRLKLSNPAYARIWGLQDGDLQGEPHVSVIVDRIRPFFPSHLHWPRLRQRIISRVNDRDARRGRLDRSDGTVLVFSSLPLADGGCLYTYLDVTDSTRVERALRERNAALETADRLKSEFIANVSYELRTPLNAIIGFAEILNQSYFGTLNERQSEYAQGILDASNRLISLINDILDIATIEAGYLQLELGPVDVRALLASVETFAVERARNRNLQFAIDCPEGIGTLVGDERRLKQAIYNIVSNSIKFTPPGGRIVISARREDDDMAITVTDTGIGIDPQDQGIVWEKFARISSQGRPTGAGLGLALVKRLIELHHGTVELHSTPGEGTQVTCNVPIAGPTAKAGPTAQAAD
jgi:signal transduction histidine kinase